MVTVDIVLTEEEEMSVAGEEVKEGSAQQILEKEEEQSGTKSASGKSVSRTSLHSTRTSVHLEQSRQHQIQTQIEALNISLEGELSSSLSQIITADTSFKIQVVLPPPLVIFD